jgi:hypothetical protein
MKKIKFIFIAVEIAALFGVSYLAYTHCAWYIATFITLFALLAVAMQKEYTTEDWMEFENEED